MFFEHRAFPSIRTAPGWIPGVGTVVCRAGNMRVAVHKGREVLTYDLIFSS
jgi:hypothetical protein